MELVDVPPPILTLMGAKDGFTTVKVNGRDVYASEETGAVIAYDLDRIEIKRLCVGGLLLVPQKGRPLVVVAPPRVGGGVPGKLPDRWGRLEIIEWLETLLKQLQDRPPEEA